VASLAHISEKNNLINLAVGLILLLLIGALMEHFPGDAGPRIVQAATVAILLVNTWGMKGTKSRLAVNIFFVLVVLLLVVGGAMLDHVGFSKAHMFLMLCFFIWLTWLVAHQVLFTGKIDTNKIIGAICIYMLLGLIWAMLYLFIAEAVPGAFNGMTQAPWLDNFATAVYFSFVTITTLGYGDVSPVLPLARFLVYMEAIVGVFYMAILVASLIGVRLSDRDVVRR
jgi:voltage-gated potassium channel